MAQSALRFTGTRSIRPTGSPMSRSGRYALYAEIAAGGMATIHIGRLLGPVGFARTVAIKRLHPPFAKDPEFVGSLLDEARLAARIRHPNVVPTLDVVATPSELFVVMEYVPGESLAALVRLGLDRGARVPIPISAAIMVGVLHGLHAAHEAEDEHGEPLRIVHRDVSPHNILVGIDGAPHVIDFGIAKARGRAQVTRDGQIKGKPSYMPPEQLLGSPVDQRADVFAASIVLWEALTGRRLFQGVDDSDVVARVLHGQVEPPSRFEPAIGPSLDAVVLRGLARDRAKRFPSARAMALAIEAAAPLASASRIGSWVEELSGESLAERSRLVAEIERGQIQPLAPSLAGHRASTSPSLRVESDADTRGRVALAREHFVGPTSSVWRRAGGRAVVALGAVLTVGVALAFWTRVHRASVAEIPPAIPVTVVSEGAVSSPLLPSPLAVSSAWQAIPEPTTGPLPTPRGRPSRSPPRPSSSRARSREPSGLQSSDSIVREMDPAVPAQRAPSIAPAATPRSCDPPFWYDAEGNKRYYRECARL